MTPTTVPGFPGRAEIRARYQAASGRDISRLDFYVAFGYWKLACILQGVYARYVGGADGRRPFQRRGIRHQRRAAGRDGASRLWSRRDPTAGAA